MALVHSLPRFSVRPMRRADCGAVAKLSRESFAYFRALGSKGDKPSRADALCAGGFGPKRVFRGYVATCDKQIVGYVLCCDGWDSVPVGLKGF